MLKPYIAFVHEIKADLKNVSKAVAGVDLRDHLVEVVITLFDEDGKCSCCVWTACLCDWFISPSPSHAGDGNLSYKEFIKTVKSRSTRGLEKVLLYSHVNQFKKLDFILSLSQPKELGFARLVTSVLACSEKMAKETLGIKTWTFIVMSRFSLVQSLLI